MKGKGEMNSNLKKSLITSILVVAFLGTLRVGGNMIDDNRKDTVYPILIHSDTIVTSCRTTTFKFPGVCPKFEIEEDTMYRSMPSIYISEDTVSIWGGTSINKLSNHHKL